MNEKYFKCTLNSDIVLNASLATEGNMTTLDYIPGSNFLGMVAAAVYAKESGFSDQQKVDLLHGEKVSFGDAVILKDGKLNYTMPFMYFRDKLKTSEHIYLHHLINHEKGIVINGTKLQLKQERTGFMNADGVIIESINKTFALKSAQNRETRTSKESAMFGFESIKAGQEFIFSIKYTSDAEIEIIEKLLIGKKRIGKSKSAEFGLVDIQHLSIPIKIGTFQENDFTLVYAESNLCFIDEETGQSTYQPKPKQLGLESGEIDWNISSIRTYTYSPWNAKRNTSNMQRNCIAKGSVFYVKNGKMNDHDDKPIGEFTAEGLGRVIYNPEFLKGKDGGILDFKIEPKEKPKEASKITPGEDYKTNLGQKLFSKYVKKQLELQVAKKVVAELKEGLNDNLKNITPSQWGGIRAIATNETNIDKLYVKLFANQTGYLTHGVADEKHWGKNNGKNRKDFEKIFSDNKGLGTVFIAKLAGEFAKLSKKQND